MRTRRSHARTALSAPALSHPPCARQVLRIVTLGEGGGRGGFFPNGVNGRINSTAGFSTAANARGGWPGSRVTVKSLQEVGKAGLLNSSITAVTPPPEDVQREASGCEYVKSC